MNLIVPAVFEFNKIVLGINQRGYGLMPLNELNITIESLNEELDEFIEAQNEGDIVKMVDALCDCMYFAIGAMYKNGNTADLALITICGKYMDKSQFLDRIYTTLNFEHLGVFLPTEEHRDSIHDSIDLSIDVLDAECAKDNASASSVDQKLAGVIEQCIIGLYSFGVQPNQVHEIMLAINEANMTKKKGVNAKRGDGVAADAIKPDGWIPPEESIKRILKLDCPA